MSDGKAMAAIMLLCAIMPVPAPAQTTVNVAGQVLGPDGEPVSEATVLVQYTGPDERYATQRGTTDADGRFALELELGRWERLVRVAAQKPGLALDWRAVKPGDTVTLELGAEPATFSGVVTDTDGNPIAGAEAHIHALWRPPGDPVVQETAARYADIEDIVWTWFFPHDPTLLAATSDGTGRFEIHGLPPDQEVRVTVRAPGRERLTMTRDEVPANTQHFEAVLGPGAVITGRVMHDGRPVGGVEVDCRSRGPGEGSAMTGEDGTFTVGELGPGTYDIHVHGPEGLVGARGGPVTLLPGARATGVEVVLTPGTMLEGTITDGEAGEPIVGAAVFASADRYDGYARSDERGRYAIRVPAGRFEIRCYSPYGPPYPRTDPANHPIETAEGEAKTNLNFTAWPSSKTVLRGRIVDVDGQPVPGAKVGGPPGVRVISGTYEGYFPATCDAQGRFELEIRSDEVQGHDLPVLAMEPERGVAGLAMMPQAEVPNDPVEIEVQRGGRVSGVVEDADMNPLPGVPIRLALSPRGHGVQYSMYAATTDERGAFSIGPLPTGARYSGSLGGQYGELVVSDRRISGELAPGEHVQLEPIVVNVVGRSLAGWVMEADGRPMRNAMVCISGLDDPVRSDADGRFEFTGLPTRGKLWVVAVHPTKPLCAAEQVDPDWELEPGLILQKTGSAEGRVVDEAGKPGPGVTLKGWPQFSIEYPEGGRSGRGHNWVFSVGLRVRGSDGALLATTGADGRWRAEGLIGGASYHFGIEADGERVGSVAVTAVPGETVDAGETKLRPPED